MPHTSIGERIEQIADYLNLSIRGFELEVGISNGVIRKASRTGGSLRADTIEKIVSKYREINPYWLLTGEEEMLLDPNEEPNMVEEEAPEYGGEGIITRYIDLLEQNLKEKDRKIEELQKRLGEEGE